MTSKNQKIVGIWLLLGALMVFIQVIIGGITRLTESGLSITEWDVVTGTIPPLSQEAWEDVFAAYQQSPEYQQVNKGMTLSEFKTIYFWEYFHRLWARLLGFVFLIPFVYFLYKKMMDRSTIKKSLIAFGLGGLAGVFGWLMVLSGLDERPMVSPYRLAIHLAIAIGTLAYLVWIALDLLWSKELSRETGGLKKWLHGLTAITAFQILVGALVSGMEAAPVYPTWPDMNNAFIPAVMLDPGNWSWQAFINFDKVVLPHAVVQFVHRNTAYLMVILGLGIAWQAFRPQVRNSLSKPAKTLFALIPTVLLIQAILGISILLTVTAHIPIVLGVIHQAIAILFLVILVMLEYRLK